LSFLGAQKQNKTRRRPTFVHHRLLCVHKNKIKKDDDKPQLVVIFSGCKEKTKKTTTSTSLSSFLSVHKNKTKKTMMNTNAHPCFLQL